MLIGILAATVVASGGVDAGFTPPDWAKRLQPEDIRGVWPSLAQRSGIGGKVAIDCRVNIHGLVEDCRVLSEEPAGQGFGGAALLLTPQMLFRPARRNGVPEPSRITVPITFASGGLAHAPEIVPTVTVAMLDRPVWAIAPSFQDVAAAYPSTGGGLDGYVLFYCEVKKDESLRNCALIKEEPKGRGFEAAGRRLIGKFRLSVDPAAYKGPIGVNLRIRLTDPAGDEQIHRRVGEPQWTAGLDPEQTQRLFPAEAVTKGVKTGLGVAHCTVTPDGALTACEPRRGDPDGLGFSEAAVRVAEVMKMNPWTQEGGPVDGAGINLPIRFNLAVTKPPLK